MNLEEIYSAALEHRAPGDRAAFLDEACGIDRELRRRVERLLEARSERGRFLESPAPGLTLPADDWPAADRVGMVIGPYKLLEVIGEGGMGVVYKAVQDRPVRREVALKIIKPGMDTRQVIARFEAERQALALMDHPHIARVLDAGATESGLPYFVMELIRGVSITKFCDQQRLGLDQRLNLFVLVCHAVQHAHQKGVIHRDIKPANVLITLHDSAPAPKVIDFGIAKAIGQSMAGETVMTGLAQMIGTPLYMSPEQAELTGIDVDTRSDIYSLGVLLYELLAGTTPFDQETFRRAALDEVRRIIREEEPPTPSTRLGGLGARLEAVSAGRQIDARKLNRSIRGELDWITMKALEKDRDRRYATAGELAADIRRHLSDVPVEAGPPSIWYPLAKFARRNRAALATSAVVASALVLGTIVSTLQARRALRAERAERTQRGIADRHAGELAAATDSLEWQLYFSRVNWAQAEWSANHVGIAEQLLDSCPQSRRGWEWQYCRRLCHLERSTFRGHASAVVGLAFSPDGKHSVSASRGDEKQQIPGELLLWDLESLGEVSSTMIPEASCLAYDPHGNLAAIGEVNRPDVILLDPRSGRLIRSLILPLERRIGQVDCLSFSPDGRQIVVATRYIRQGRPMGWRDLWDVETGALRLSFPEGDAASLGLAFSPDGSRIATADHDGLVRLWDATHGRVLMTMRGHDGRVFDVAFSRDGKKLASAGWDGTIRLWDPDDGKLIAVMFGHTSFVRSIAFSPDGTKLVSAGEDHVLKLWDTSTSREIATLRGHYNFINRVAISPDGIQLASASSDATVKLWDLASDHHLRALRHDSWVQSVAFSPDGLRIASASRDKTVKLWDRASGRELRTFRGHGGEVSCVAFSPDGREIVTACWDGLVRIWDSDSGDLVRTFNGHRERVLGVAYSPDGSRISSAGWDGTVRLWEARTGREVRRFLGHAGIVAAVTFSPDGRRLASAGVDDTLKVWDAGTGQVELTLDCETDQDDSTSRAGMLAFSRDGRRIMGCSTPASGGQSEVRVWDAATGRRLRTLSGHALPINAVAISPDGKRIASASNDMTVKLWDSATGKEVFALRGHNSAVLGLAFSPDGRSLATGSIDFTVKIWDAPPDASEIRSP